LRLLDAKRRSAYLLRTTVDKRLAGIKLLRLRKKLSSFIQIRTYKNVSYNVKQWVSIIDYDKCISRGIEHGFYGTAYAKNPLFNERMRHQFEDLWQQAQPSIEARRLAI
jgi:isocitrate/isopropylmalate dehydrogenase